MFSQRPEQFNSLLNDFITYGAWAVTAACAAEIGWVFYHKQDLLGGFGLVTQNKDAIALVKGYALAGAVSFSLATLKYAKYTILGLGIYAASTLYGATFYFNANRLPHMPAVETSHLDTAMKAKKDTTIINSGLDKVEITAKEAQLAGYVQRGTVSESGMEWCNADDDSDGIKNADDKDNNGQQPSYDTSAAHFNCATGFKWVMAGN